MTPNTFIHRGDLINEINKLGALYDIKNEVIDNQHVFMLACSNTHERCDAKLLGMYSQKDKLFHIRRVDSLHSCSKNSKREVALYAEIKKHNDIHRIGELVEKVNTKFKVGYYEVFKAQNKGGLTLEFFDKENLRNTGNMFLNEFGYTNDRENLNYQKNEDLRLECHLSLKREITDMNEQIKCFCNRTGFFYKNMQMMQVFRRVSELKIYQRTGGTLVMGLLFDPWDDYVINSFIVSDDSKIKALEQFIEYDKQTLEKEESQFFIIDFDAEVIHYLISRNFPFFIKTRAVAAYLQENRIEDQQVIDYFNILNNGNIELLDIDKKYYLNKHCPVNLYNLNNSHYPDFEYITKNILGQSLIDTVVSLMWLVSEDIKIRKVYGQEELEQRFSESLHAIFETYNEIDNTPSMKVNLEKCSCECGRFQENLYPCIHAYKNIMKQEKDPFLYVSRIYSKEQYSRLTDVISVVNMKVHPNKSKPVIKRRRTEQNDTEEY